MLQANDKIPAFSLEDDRGKIVHSADLLGKRFVLFFYPKDATPACTTEVCAFRDELPKFKRLGVPVFGVSADSAASHRKFVEKQALTYRLLADPDRVLIDRSGVWVEKVLYGRKYMGIQRCTFLVDATGRIEHVWPKVTVKTHASEVLAFVRGEDPSTMATPKKPAVPVKPKKPVVRSKAAPRRAR